MFCGKDMGLTYYIHPSDVTPLLPKETVSLTLEQRQVLYVHSALKSFARKDELQRNEAFGMKRYGPFDTANYERVKAELVALGMLQANGAVTIKGKNARGNSFNYPKE